MSGSRFFSSNLGEGSFGLWGDIRLFPTLSESNQPKPVSPSPQTPKPKAKLLREREPFSFYFPKSPEGRQLKQLIKEVRQKLELNQSAKAIESIRNSKDLVDDWSCHPLIVLVLHFCQNDQMDQAAELIREFQAQFPAACQEGAERLLTAYRVEKWLHNRQASALDERIKLFREFQGLLEDRDSFHDLIDLLEDLALDNRLNEAIQLVHEFKAIFPQACKAGLECVVKKAELPKEKSALKGRFKKEFPEFFKSK